jgi:hypothetical protein
VTKRRLWKPDAGETYRLIVRCRGRRIAGVSADPHRNLLVSYLHTLSIAGARAGGMTRLVIGPLLDRDRQIGPCPCPNHKSGHMIDSGRLRAACNRLCPPSKVNVASLDVDQVESTLRP